MIAARCHLGFSLPDYDPAKLPSCHSARLPTYHPASLSDRHPPWHATEPGLVSSLPAAAANVPAAAAAIQRRSWAVAPAIPWSEAASACAFAPRWHSLLRFPETARGPRIPAVPQKHRSPEFHYEERQPDLLPTWYGPTGYASGSPTCSAPIWSANPPELRLSQHEPRGHATLACRAPAAAAKCRPNLPSAPDAPTLAKHGRGQ